MKLNLKKILVLLIFACPAIQADARKINHKVDINFGPLAVGALSYVATDIIHTELRREKYKPWIARTVSFLIVFGTVVFVEMFTAPLDGFQAATPAAASMGSAMALNFHR